MMDAGRVARKLKAIDVIDILSDLIILRGIPGHIRSDNGPELVAFIESWRRHYNAIRPHTSLGYKPPAPEVFVPAFAAWPAALHRPAPPTTLAQPPTLN